MQKSDVLCLGNSKVYKFIESILYIQNLSIGILVIASRVSARAWACWCLWLVLNT